MGLVTFFLKALPLVFLVTLPSLASPTIHTALDIISGQPHTGPSTVQFTSDSSGFDGPKIQNLNSTVFDLWYFDVISSDLQNSAVLVFFTAKPTALFPGLPDLGTATWMLVEVTLANGSTFETLIPGDQLTVTTVGNGASGMLSGGVAGWQGSSDMTKYVVTINAPDYGITGTLMLQSAAPAHFPCVPTTAGAGQTFRLTHSLGWFNAVPDANGAVNLMLNGQPTHFSGPGYHDKNWGSQPWNTTLRSWYWGHARVGPYSVVWFDVVDPQGKEAASGYISQNDKILSASCSGARVRPTGQHAVYPPTSKTALPDGFSISMSVPGHSDFEVTLKNYEVIDQADGLSTRWLGEVSGGFGGKQQYQGIGLYEQFTFV